MPGAQMALLRWPPSQRSSALRVFAPTYLDRTGPAMRVGEIDFCNPRVTANHLQGAMSKNGLQCQDVAATPQVGDGERVAEPVWEAVLDPSSRRDGFD